MILAGGELGATQRPTPLISFKISNPDADVSNLSPEQQKAKAKSLLKWGLLIGIPVAIFASVWNAHRKYKEFGRARDILKGKKPLFGIW